MPKNTNITTTKPARSNIQKALQHIPEKREIHFIAEENKHVSYRKYYVSHTDRRALIDEVNDSGLLLYEYYLSLVNNKNQDEITDKTTAEHFGWGIPKARRIRQALIKSGWFRSEGFAYSRGRKGTTYYLGKYVVKHGHIPKSAVAQPWA